MAVARCGVLGFAVLTLLADIPPSGCGSAARPRPSYTAFSIRASDCSCASEPIQLRIDGRDVGVLYCGASNSVSVDVAGGTHLVSATSGTRTWPERSYDAVVGQATPVDLGCPTTAPR
jgi:hypothetical protein